MHTRIDRPTYLDPEDLDAYLARGWYRVGQIMMTCRFVLNDTGLRSAVWTRVPLNDYVFKKSHRKQLSKIERRFRITEGPASPDLTREATYQRYLSVARGERSESLQEFLGSEWDSRFDTREIALWDGDRLAGFSWYDIGGKSLQSLIGVYDPDYRNMSLGFTTVLLEIRESLRRNLDFYYAGYVLPGDPTMDYKLRPQPIEYLCHETDRWLPWDLIELESLPAELVRTRLETARQALRTVGIEARPLLNSPYGLRSERLPQLLGEPLVLDLKGGSRRVTDLVSWDLERGAWRVQRCARAWAQRVGADGEKLDPVQVWVVVSDLAVAETTDDLIRKVSL